MSELNKVNENDDIILKYRKRILRNKDLIDIRKLIQEHPDASRRRLSALLCELWDWRQENGILKDMVCRSLMLILHRAGHIQLPEVRRINRNPIVERHRPKELEVTFQGSGFFFGLIYCMYCGLRVERAHVCLKHVHPTGGWLCGRVLTNGRHPSPPGSGGHLAAGFPL